MASVSIQLGSLLKDLGEHAAAELQYRKALAQLDSLAAEFPKVLANYKALVRAHNCLGDLFEGLGKQSQADEEYRTASALQQTLLTDFPYQPDRRQQPKPNRDD